MKTLRSARVARPGRALLAGLLLFALASEAYASKTARTISTTASAVGFWHGLITVVAPNPVTGITSLIYSGISLGATIYDGVVDPPPAGPAVVDRVAAGPATDRNPVDWELSAGGADLAAAPAGRLVSLIGHNFSFVRDDMTVTFDGTPAVIAPLASNTLVSVAVPFLGGPLPRQVTVQVTVKGVAGVPFSFRVLPAQAPGASVDRVLGKLELLAQKTGAFDWEGLIDVENPGLPADGRGQALGGAQQMIEGSREALARLAEFRTLLADDPGFRQVNEVVLAESPEVEALIDAALAALDLAADGAPLR